MKTNNIGEKNDVRSYAEASEGQFVLETFEIKRKR